MREPRRVGAAAWCGRRSPPSRSTSPASHAARIRHRRPTMTTKDATRSTYDVIRTKRDTRAYADRPIPEETLQRILQAGRMAGSSKNSQPVRFVVLRDRARKEELAARGDFATELAWAPLAGGLLLAPGGG